MSSRESFVTVINSLERTEGGRGGAGEGRGGTMIEEEEEVGERDGDGVGEESLTAVECVQRAD